MECKHFKIVNQTIAILVSIIDKKVPSEPQQLFNIERYMTTVCYAVDRHVGDKFSLKAEMHILVRVPFYRTLNYL